MSDTPEEKTFDDTDPRFTGISKDLSRMKDTTIEADPTLWREKRKRHRRKKFDDNLKSVFLASLLSHGKIILAAKDAKIALSTIGVHRSEDEDFNDAVEETIAQHAKDIIQKIELRAMEGYDNPVFNKDGDEVGTKTTMETALAVKMLARHDPEYRDKSALDITSGGGVILSPPTVTLEEWSVIAAKSRQRMLDHQAEQEAEDAQG